jgi:hypothetical protein
MARITISVNRFVEMPDGLHQFRPFPYEGEVWTRWHEDPERGRSFGHDFILFTDGRIFKRSDSYMPSSVFGWDEVTQDFTVTVLESEYGGLSELPS